MVGLHPAKGFSTRPPSTVIAARLVPRAAEACHRPLIVAGILSWCSQ
jgi:hypothetical protein